MRINYDLPNRCGTGACEHNERFQTASECGMSSITTKEVNVGSCINGRQKAREIVIVCYVSMNSKLLFQLIPYFI
jgi:hypothetical protein